MKKRCVSEDVLAKARERLEKLTVERTAAVEKLQSVWVETMHEQDVAELTSAIKASRDAGVHHKAYMISFDSEGIEVVPGAAYVAKAEAWLNTSALRARRPRSS